MQETTATTSETNNFRHDFANFLKRDFHEELSKNPTSSIDHEATDRDEELKDEFLNKATSEAYVDMLEFRQKLPAHKHKEQIISLIEKDQVVLVEGSTGCGKTTQVPQFILDDALMNSKGSRTRILCTQPRRIAGKLYKHFF